MSNSAKSENEGQSAVDSDEGRVGTNFEEKDKIACEIKLNPEIRNVVFEQDNTEKCILASNEGLHVFKDDTVSEFYSSVIRKNICRKFLVELRKRWAQAQNTSYAHEYDQLYDQCLRSIHHDYTPNNSVYIHDLLRAQITECILFRLDSKYSQNDKWQLLQCLLEVCPIAKDSPAQPVFSVEPVGRDGWTLTTYGERPQQHQLFPGLPVVIATDDGLVYTATFVRSQSKRRLCMLDQT